MLSASEISAMIRAKKKKMEQEDGMVSLSGIPEDATDIMINKNHEEGERNSINHPDEQIDEELMGNPGIDDMADGGKVEEPEMDKEKMLRHAKIRKMMARMAI